jgi:hypothetical protein
MKLLKYMKDGGPESHCFGFFLIEIKSLFSVAFIKFTPGSRDAYHTHAFNAVSWVLKGKLVEKSLYGPTREYLPSFKPILTTRDDFHKVVSEGESTILTLRGPWVKFWREYLPQENKFINLTHGRNVVTGWWK